MPNYRRIKIKGGTYFITLVTFKRQIIFATAENRELFIKSINHVRKYHPFYLEAYCILPDHIHLLCRLPDDDDNFSMRIAEIKKRFSKQYLENLEQSPTSSSTSVKRKESGLWQRRFWEHTIRDE